MDIQKKIMDTMLDLVSIPGISGTESENLTSQRIFNILGDFPYFKENPDNLKIITIEDDPLKRTFVSALFRSSNKSNKTLILNSHLDVVGIDEFGHLKDIAFNPVELTKRIRELKLHDEAISDLDSGDYIFGRGTADMKYGVALHIELLRTIAEKDDINGNILFLCVPGEESNSEGMLGAVPHLVKLQETLNLEYTGVLVSECCIPKYPKDPNRYVYLGTVGKVMPLFFFAGKESHVCEPFNSISSNLLASQLNSLLEYNTDFCDTSLGEVSPPPLCLKQMDLKELYSVQIPLYSVSYYNLLTLNLEIDKLIDKLNNLCVKAFEETLELINKNRALYEKETNTKSSIIEVKPCVMTFDELYGKVKNIYGSEFDNYINNVVLECQNKGMDNQSIAIRIMKETYEKYPEKVPMIIIGFAPPFYPDKHINTENIQGLSFMNAINKVIEYADDKYGINIKKDNYFMGICDMSYTGLSDSGSIGIDKIASNMLCSNLNYSLPVESLKKLDIPGAVFGGYGKDFHKYTERLNLSYSLNVVPDLYEQLIYTLLK